MRNALIDTGSNTIRLVIYENDREILNTAIHANLISHVHGGKMSVEGLMKLVSAFKEMKKKAKEYKCSEIYAFATASLRDIEDKESLCSCVSELTGIDIDIISGEDEAMYDYIGLKSENGDDTGAAFDLGGGSCQVIVYESGKVREFMSMKIGSLKLHTDIVSGILPNEDEKEEIRRAVRKELSALSLLNGSGYEKLPAMGGAAYALMQLSERYFGGERLDVKTLEKIAGLSEKEILDVCPKRLKTVVPAALTVAEILEYSKSDFVVPTTVGVRDGIYKSKFLIEKNA